MLLLQSKGRRASHVQQGYEADDSSSQDASWEPRRLPISYNPSLVGRSSSAYRLRCALSGATHECRAGAWLACGPLSLATQL